MTIDIITYTEAQFAALSEEQIQEIRSVQMRKNRLERKLEEAYQKEKNRLIKNGTFHSKIWEQTKDALKAEFDAEVENLREALLFYLQYSAKPNTEQTEEAPYTVDYSYSYEDRFTTVQDYYMNAYSDPQERLDALKQDQVAMQYLGEYYSSLHDYFYALI